MLRRLRPVTAAVLALAFVAGPVSAACLHGLAHGADHAAMGHEMPGHEMPAGHQMPMGEEPCHDEPPAPEPVADDCVSPCCTAERAVEAPAVTVPPVELAVLVRTVLVEVGPVGVVAPAVGPREHPPPPLRRHVELQRFLI